MSAIRSITRVARTAQRPIYSQTTIRAYSSSGDSVGPSMSFPSCTISSSPPSPYLRHLQIYPLRSSLTLVALAHILTQSTNLLPTDKTHTTDKPKVDVQSTPSNQAMEGKKAESDNSGATQQSDTHNSNQRAANESKAPGNTVIGMNDERGGKGM
jgi:hypothetical protein